MSEVALDACEVVEGVSVGSLRFAVVTPSRTTIGFSSLEGLAVVSLPKGGGDVCVTWVKDGRRVRYRSSHPYLHKLASVTLARLRVWLSQMGIALPTSTDRPVAYRFEWGGDRLSAYKRSL